MPWYPASGSGNDILVFSYISYSHMLAMRSGVMPHQHPRNTFGSEASIFGSALPGGMGP